jgi:uncharacterized protein (TIGR02996 family)
MVVARVTPEVFEALRRDPGDDAGWQVLADALGEVGDVRAEVIRLELQLVGAPPEEREASRSALAKLDKHRKTWARGLPAGVGVARWSRGFVAAITVPATPDAPGLIGRAFSAEVCVLTTGLRLVSAARAEDSEGEEDDEDDEYAEDCDEDGDELPIVDVAWLAGADLGRVTTLSLAYLNVGPQGAEVLSDHAVLGSTARRSPSCSRGRSQGSSGSRFRGTSSVLEEPLRSPAPRCRPCASSTCATPGSVTKGWSRSFRLPRCLGSRRCACIDAI